MRTQPSSPTVLFLEILARLGIDPRSLAASPTHRNGRLVVGNSEATLGKLWEFFRIIDREYRCPKCLHWWVSHGVPTEDYYGCMTIESSAAERWEMSQRDRELQRQGVPPKLAGPQAYRELRYCGCTFAEGNTVTPRQVRMAEG